MACFIPATRLSPPTDTQTWVSMGMGVSIAQTREHIGWREPEDDEPILGRSPSAAPGSAGILPASPGGRDPQFGVPALAGSPEAVNGNGEPRPTAPATQALDAQEPRRYKNPNWQPA